MRKKSEKVNYVYIWDLPCWKCAELHKDPYSNGKYYCYQNLFSASEVYPDYFACKCARFKPVKPVSHEQK